MGSSHLLLKLHSMDEFGVVHGVVKGIRVRPVSGKNPVIVPFPHKHDFHQIALFTQGGGWHEIDFCRYQIRPNHLYFTRRGQVHEWSLAPESKGFVLDFSNSAVSGSAIPGSYAWSPVQLQSQFDLSKAPKMRRTHVLNLIAMMIDEYESQAPNFELSLTCFLMPILIEMQRLHENGISKACTLDPIAERFVDLVEEHFKRQHGVTFYAKKLGTTPKALTMRVSRTMGKAARTVIHGRCQLEAKRLLAHSALAISQIGYEVGFSDLGHFSRFFRKHVGTSPGKFRSEFAQGIRTASPQLEQRRNHSPADVTRGTDPGQ